MIGYIIRRIMATIPVVLVVAVFIFSLLFLTPGDPAAVIAGDTASPADIQRIRENLGLERPFLIQFGEWMWNVLQGNLGNSVFTGLPVSRMIMQRIEPTLSLTFLTMVLSVLVAVPLGVFAAWRNGTTIDRSIMALAVLGFSVPVFVVGYSLAYIFALELGWLPVQGYVPIARGIDRWFLSLILPSLALGSVYIALIARTTRATMLEVLQQDYVRTATAKGLRPLQVLFVHSLRNAAVPVITVIGIGFTLLISGAVVTETVFGIPGLGRLTVDAVLQRDYPVIQGVVLLFSVLYVLINLLIDITYTLVDPRISY
ncbi:putative peptide ABC transporter permease protein y4tP [Hyphomicrobiales bacterium]|nr:putative peptide ABC transporter permease protein y4tP [Hyphomicrobiales bacterium]CAH1677668.1 putative peptide ABC transporter permease protein y4tP [Hyphomicrobiales bacterium]